MRYRVRGSKEGSNETVFAPDAAGALAAFHKLVDDGYIVAVTDTETGADIRDVDLYDMAEQSDA